MSKKKLIESIIFTIIGIMAIIEIISKEIVYIPILATSGLFTGMSLRKLIDEYNKNGDEE